eukprot:m.72000 g.72000  ORF g.72000 m.72000 type:complete len:483 (+) comp14235_c0_seq1:85-1533(+)
MEDLSERLLAPETIVSNESNDDEQALGMVSNQVREGLLQDDTVEISSHSTSDQHCIKPSSSSHFWHLLATPLLTVAVLIFFLATGPGNVGSFSDTVYANPALIVFGTVAQVVAFVWVLALALKVFHRSRYISIALFLPALDNMHGVVARIALELSIAHATCVLLYIAVFWHPSSTNDDGYTVPFSPLWLQFMGFVVPLGLTLTPYMSGWQLRKEFWQLFAQSMSCIVGWSPLTEVHFRLVLLTDALTSAMDLVGGLSYSVCHFTTSSWLSTRIDQANSASSDLCGRDSRFGLWGTPILTCVPFWLRLVQCLCLYRLALQHKREGWARWQHIANASKYLISILAVWNMAALKLDNYYEHDESEVTWKHWHTSAYLLVGIRTLYVYVWDIRMDWALARGASTPRFLRNRLLFRPIYAYYIAMGSNLVARFVWILTIDALWCYAGCSGLFAFIEVFRRGQWFIYRLEHEQLKVTRYVESLKETQL